MTEREGGGELDQSRNRKQITPKEKDCPLMAATKKKDAVHELGKIKSKMKRPNIINKE